MPRTTTRGTLGDQNVPASAAAVSLPRRLLGLVKDHIGHTPRVIVGGNPLGLTPSLVRALAKGRADGSRHDVGDADVVPPLLQELDT